MIKASILVAGLMLFSAVAAQTAPESVTYGRFGEISIYRGSGDPDELVLFLSGDGGWNLGVISMAKHLADKGAVVAGIDIRHYLAQLENASEDCVSPSTDLENLSRYLQPKLGLKRALQPTLVGYSSGATLVYATLVQAPQGLFNGALSLGFSADLDLKKPLCKGSGIEATPRRGTDGNLKGVDFLPAKKLSAKWIVLQGEIDQVCPAAPTQKFVDKVPGGEIILLPKVGHGYSVERNWLPQYEAAFERVTREPKDLGR
jgi:type IV secretory pathway VirJ component